MNEPAPYRRPYPSTQPEYLFPKYASTVKRAPTEPLVVLPHTLSELTAPVFGYGDVKETDHDLTRQHQGEPLGERIVVSGRVLDENGKPLPGVLVEIWQANAAGRYNHRVDQHDAPLDPNFAGAGRFLTDAAGTLPVHDHPARRVPLAQPLQRLAAGAHPFLAVRPRDRHAPHHADVLSGRSPARLRPDVHLRVRREGAQPADLDLRLGDDDARVRARLPLRHRPARPRATPMEKRPMETRR